jgi:hypothetical protein
MIEIIPNLRLERNFEKMGQINLNCTFAPVPARSFTEKTALGSDIPRISGAAYRFQSLPRVQFFPSKTIIVIISHFQIFFVFLRLIYKKIQGCSVSFFMDKNLSKNLASGAFRRPVKPGPLIFPDLGITHQ